ncbi:hypothetical protein [Amycolatopsis sp. RTGN1]|uniref:hypothetical protein n=1 Tax=Amycolatopsis ponsaeliensis TaxID=2992142 RepID=UPI00254FA12C|nr:hypothetical protein [Amycolatopsis sp. RTGN1]
MSKDVHQHDDNAVRADEQLVSGDGQPAFPARLGEPQLIAETDGDQQFYTVTPRFRRAVAEWVAISVEATFDHLRFRWDGADLLVIDDAAIDPDDPASTPHIDRIRPDSSGRYFFDGWLWNEADATTHRSDDTSRAALTLLAQDRPRPVAPLIRYVAERTDPPLDPAELRRIRRRHRTRTTSVLSVTALRPKHGEAEE